MALARRQSQQIPVWVMLEEEEVQVEGISSWREMGFGLPVVLLAAALRLRLLKFCSYSTSCPQGLYAFWWEFYVQSHASSSRWLEEGSSRSCS
jgi:hypothetical protein